VVIIVAPAGVGVIAGLAFLNAIGRRWPRPNAIGTGLIVALSALLFLAAARPLTELFSRAGSPGLGAAFPAFVAVVAGTAFVFGISYAFITVPAMTLLQEELRDDIRGRVFGFLNMLVSIFSLVPLVVVGPIADLWGVAPVFVGFAVIVGIAWVGGKSTREMRREKAKLANE
jgi:MFS family permease